MLIETRVLKIAEQINKKTKIEERNRMRTIYKGFFFITGSPFSCNAVNGFIE